MMNTFPAATRPYFIALAAVVAVVLLFQVYRAARQKEFGSASAWLVMVVMVATFPFWIDSIPFLPKLV